MTAHRENARVIGACPARSVPAQTKAGARASTPSGSSRAQDRIYCARRFRLGVRTDHTNVGSRPYALRKGSIWAAGAGRGRADAKETDSPIVPGRTNATGKAQEVQWLNQDWGSSRSAGASASRLLMRPLGLPLPEVRGQGGRPLQSGFTNSRFSNTLQKNIPGIVFTGWANDMFSRNRAPVGTRQPAARAASNEREV